MKKDVIKGIRILDKNKRIVSVELPDILEEIQNGNSFYWSILYLDGEGKRVSMLEERVEQSKRCLQVNWDELNLLSKNLEDVFDLGLIGCKDKKLLRRYETDREMYETCDIVILMVDSSFWEVFSKDEDFIKRLGSKFKDIKFLESDYEP